MCCSSHIESVWGCGTQYRETPLQSRMYSEASSAGPGSAMLPLLLLCQNSSCKVDWCRSLLTSAAQSHCLLQACAGNWPPTLALVHRFTGNTLLVMGCPAHCRPAHPKS